MSKTASDLCEHPAIVTALTVAVFVGAQRAQGRWPRVPLFNPTLVGVVAVIAYVECSGISYQRYILNTQVLSFMLAPTVVLLAVPLYRRLALIRASWKIITCSLLVGLPAGTLSAIGIAIAFGARDDTLYSLAGKSVTTGIAVGISESIGGIPVLTASFVIITGIFGAAFGPVLLSLLKVKDERAIGLAMGIGGHGIGTARAFQLSDKAGAFSSLAMALNGIASAIIIPGAVALLHLSRGTPSANQSDASSYLVLAQVAATNMSSANLRQGLFVLAAVLSIMAVILACAVTFGRFRRHLSSSRYVSRSE